MSDAKSAYIAGKNTPLAASTPMAPRLPPSVSVSIHCLAVSMAMGKAIEAIMALLWKDEAAASSAP